MNDNPFAPPVARAARSSDTPPTWADHVQAMALWFALGLGVSIFVAVLVFLESEFLLWPSMETMVYLGMALLWGLLILTAGRARRFIAIPSAAAGLTWGYFTTFCLISQWQSWHISWNWGDVILMLATFPGLETVSVLPMRYLGARSRRIQRERDAMNS